MAYYDVDVVISATEVSGQAGAWFPLIYVVGEGTKYGEYASLTEVMADYDEKTDAYAVANILFKQNNKPAKIAICTGAETVSEGLAPHIEKSWRQLILVNAEKKYDATVAAYIETTDKLYFTHFASKEELTTAKITEYDRTIGIVSSDTEVAYPEAAIVGATAGYEAGAFTYHCTVVKGVKPEVISTNDLNAIHEAGGFCYVQKNGRIATSNGITGSGEWIDVIDSYDYLIQNIRYDVQEVFLNNPKVGYTNAGISKIDNAVYNRLAIGYKNGMIATDDEGNAMYGTTFVPRSETTAADRAARNYPYGGFWLELAGAIHKAKIKGTVTA